MVGMDKLMLSGLVMPSKAFDGLRSTVEGHKVREGSLGEQAKKKAAKGFESVFICKLLEEMNSTIGQWGFEEDAATEQTRGIFSLCLADYLAEKGSLGLWKDIYKTIGGGEQSKMKLDEQI